MRKEYDAVPEVTEQHGADRARNEGDTEGREGGQQCGRLVALREEQVREHGDRGGRIDVEVVELDGCADQARDDDSPAGYSRDAVVVVPVHVEGSAHKTRSKSHIVGESSQLVGN